jgi:hypothetical protein
MDNILVALGHSDRVCRIHLSNVTQGLQWEKILEAMQVPFPELTDLVLHCWDGLAPVIPDNFLGGSAPRLRYLKTDWIPFLGIPNLLLSATHLIRLDLSDGPYSWDFSPRAMAICLSVLTSLDTLSLSFEFVNSRLRRRPPITRSILPGLTSFCFKGSSAYLDDLVARIDAPRLDYLSITFLFDQMNFDTPHLVQFISRTPRFQEPDEAHVTLDLNAEIKLFWASDDYARLYVEISYEDSDADIRPSSIAQVCTMCFPPLPTVENLQLEVFSRHRVWKVDVENDQWLELLRPFTAVKNLYLSEESAPVIAAALQELIGSRITEVLPSLRNIFVLGLEPSGPLQENLGQFVIARRLFGHHIAISVWARPM